jgi:hypothetical protein
MSCKLYTVIMRGSSLFKTSGFWPRVRARVLRTPVILSHATPNGALRAPPPAYRSFAAFIYPPKLSLDPNCPPGEYIFPLG